MEIGGIGDLGFFNNIDGYVNRAKDHANDVSKFEEALRRTADSQASDTVQSFSSGPAKIDKTDKLYEQCVELEIFLVKTLISSMRNTVQKSGLINEGYAGKMYEDMLYDEYAKDFAKNANFGMAEMAYLELTGQRGKTVIK
jgi:flagellar protein FlgJ